MVDPKKKRLAVARILNEGSSAETEAQRLGISARQVRKWVEAAKAFIPKAPKPEPEKVPSKNDSPPVAGTEKPKNEALNAALDAAGEGSKTSADPLPSAQDKVDARLDAERFCIETIGNIKSGIGSTIVSFRYSPPLLLSEQPVQNLIKLSPMEEGLIRANAQTLYPILLRWMAGPYQIIGGLLLGQLLMFVGLDNLAKNRGWVEKEKPAAPPPIVPTVFKAAAGPAATAPAWKPPAEGIQTVDGTKRPMGQVSDSPAADPAAVASILLPPTEQAA